MSLADYFVRASELKTHSDGNIGGFNNAQEAALQSLVHQLQLSDGAPNTFASALVVPSSLDRMSLMTLYFLDNVDEHGTFFEIEDIVDGAVPHDEYIDEMLVMSMSQIDGAVRLELASPFDLFGVSIIEVAKEVNTPLVPEFSEDIIVVDDLFDGRVSLVGEMFDFVDPSLSFDVLSRFVSRFDDVHNYSFMDLSIFEYLLVSCDITYSAPFSPT